MIEGWPIDEGEFGAEWTTLAALAADRFDVAEAYFDMAARLEPGLDRRGQGAYFIGGIAFYVAVTLAWSVLRDRPVPALTPEGFAITPNTGGWLRYRAAADMPAGGESVGRVIEASLAPLLPRIKAATGLGEPAQWRTIADNVASGFLYIGRHLGCEARGEALGLELVRDPEFRFFNGHTGFYHVDGQCFLKRGGCCRYFTADAGDYCATCILRPPAEHVGELRRRYIAAAS